MPARELVSHRVRRFFRGCGLVDPVERTLALIKPDAVDAGNAGDIIARYSQAWRWVSGGRLRMCFTKSFRDRTKHKNDIFAVIRIGR